MSVVIRLARAGTKHAPKYRITVADSKRYVKKKFIEVLGYYNPSPGPKEQKVVLDLEKARHWIKMGAQPSDRVKHVIKMAEATSQVPATK